MRAFAIIVNLFQMVIIMGLFLTQGIGLGGKTVFALFVLLLIAFINLLVLLFHANLAADDQTSKHKEKGGLVKRQDLRVLYTSESQPSLAVNGRRFPVLDLSENGIRINIDRQEHLKKRMRGRLTLLSNETLPLKLTLIRRQGNEAALVFNQPLDFAVLLAEKQLAGK